MKGKSSIVTTVNELMTTDVLFVSQEASIDECMDLMSENHIRHLPVIEDEKLIAVISIGDVVNAHLKETVFENRSLKDYIQGPMR